MGSDRTLRSRCLYVSDTEIAQPYGQAVLNDFTGRHGLLADDHRVVFLRSTVLNAFFTQGDEQTGCPNEVFMQELAEVACEAMLQLNLL